MGFRDQIAALLGISAHQAASRSVAVPEISPEVLERLRELNGGMLGAMPRTITRWYPKDLEDTERLADTGDLSRAAILMRSARKDGVYSGVLSTRTSGLVRLPKRFRGIPEIVAALDKDSDDTRGVFDEMFPATELALLAADGLELGVGVAELIPVQGRDYPIMVRLDPEFLLYRRNENQWYYRSVAGLIPITPGDGRWILHTPGGRVNPWHHGLWRAIGKAYVRKDHANMRKDNWEAKLANSARVATAPQGASEGQKDSWFQAVMAWGTNTVFGMTPGYDVKLLESNGRGYESFRSTIEDQNNEFVIAVAGQTVTTDGGAGFQNSDIHKSIRADLIKATADGLAYTINTQGLPSYIADTFGLDALTPGAVVEWDVTPPKDRNSEASALQITAQAIAQLTRSLAAHGMRLDANVIATRMGIPLIQEDADDVDRPPIVPLSDADASKVVLVDEARASLRLAPIGGERGAMTVAELGATAEAEAEASRDIATASAEAALEPEQAAA